MFTGIIEEIGLVKRAIPRKGNIQIEIAATAVAQRLKIGDSVSISGICQTVIAAIPEGFVVEAIKETLDRTNLGRWQAGTRVNIELPIAADGLLHGHLVQGHVDCISRITKIRRPGGSTDFWFDYSEEYGNYLIEKGSVAVDGVSLTVVDVKPAVFSVSIIPHTIESTTFQFNRTGDFVNLEFDMVAKYIEKMMSPGETKLTPEFLKEHGF